MKEKLLSLTINTQGFDTVIKNAGSKKAKTYRGLKSQINHNNRTEKMDSDYLLKPQNTKNNIHIIQDNLDKYIQDMILKMQEDYFNHYKRKMPSNVKPFINGLITFSEEMQEDIKKYGIKEMTNSIIEFLKLEYGDIISVDLHLDETTPHFHFQVLNYNFKQHKTHSRILETRLRDKNNIERRNITQDNLANHLKKDIKDFEYKRGKIQSTKEYHSKRKAQQKVIENQELKIKRLEHDLSFIKKEKEKLENENLKLTDNQKKLYEEMEELRTDHQETYTEYIDFINKIISDLIELAEIKKYDSFIDKVKRYMNNENQEALDKLLSKMQRQITAVRKKSSSPKM